LLAAAAPARARGETVEPHWQLDASGLYYRERARTQVAEPVAKITRLLPGGQSLSATFTLDAMSGASPTGAQPSGHVVTTTSASGTVTTHSANEIPTAPFHDFRGAVDLGWVRPAGPLTFTTGGLVSLERDYRSFGAREQLALDFDQHLSTLTLGGGVSRDRVNPIGGMRAGLTDGTVFLDASSDTRRSTEGLLGLSRVLSRRWMVSASATVAAERGYLTEPYKIVSLVQDTGPDLGAPSPDSALTENRPRTRRRTSVLGSSVYHLASDVVYASYRWYRDDWGVRSHTVDLRYRRQLGERTWWQPHLRWYRQDAADFFVYGLPLSLPPEARPEFATSDFRLGPLRTATLGLTYGFPVGLAPGDATVRLEYLRQWGAGHPAGAIGVQRSLDLFPPEDVGTVTMGYTLRF
jgi:hypothetical protein